MLCSYSIFSPNEVCLVNHKKADVLDILPLLPTPREDVPFIGGTDNDVAFSQELQICASLSSQQHNLFVQDVLEFLVPVDKHLRDNN